MKIFAISDLHLSKSVEKPMDIFGDGWQNHFDKISEDWLRKVSEDDLVLLGGDISWGINLEEAQADYTSISKLSGKKFVLRGNHDFYWNSLSKMRDAFPDFNFVQNNCYKEKNVIICGARGWNIPTDESNEQDKKIYLRELQRLELSLTSAKEKQTDGDILIALLHYPPFNANYNSTEVTALLEKYNVNFALYGHLHGKNVRVKEKLEKNNVTYLLTSCDLIDNKLVFVTEVL